MFRLYPRVAKFTGLLVAVLLCWSFSAFACHKISWERCCVRSGDGLWVFARHRAWKENPIKIGFFHISRVIFELLSFPFGRVVRKIL